MELVDALEQTYEQTYKVIAGVRSDQLDDPTPCADWNVRDLLTHAIGVVAGMAAATAGEPRSEFVLGSDPAAQFRAAADANLAGWRRPGVMDETVNAGPGPMPGKVLANINLLDTATHTWDIATATGQPGTLPDAVAGMALEASRQIVNPKLREGRFDPEVDVTGDAGATDRLVAFLGRQPAG
jgi:uncharacterized protein (TIGR03086 family)